MGKTQNKRKINKSFRMTRRIRGGKPKLDSAIISKLQKKLNDKQRAEHDKQMAERAAIIDQMNAAPAVEQSGWFWWLPKMQTEKKLIIEAESKKEEERKQLIASELKAIEDEKERKAMEEKAVLEKATRKKDKKNRQKETIMAKKEEQVRLEEEQVRLEEKHRSIAKPDSEVELKVSTDHEDTVVLSAVLPPPPPPKKQKPKRTINIENITLFTESRLQKLKALTVSAEDLTTNETTVVTEYTDTGKQLEYPMRNVFYEPNDPNTIVKYGNEVFDPANSVLKSILRKMFVLYGAVATQLYTTKSPYQLVMKGTRALYLNKEAFGKTLITNDIDVAIIRRSNHVEDPETSYETRKKLAEYIGSLIKTLCKVDGYEIDSSIPIQNQNIVKITYRNPSSGERIGLSDIAITQEDMIDKSPNPAVDIYSYIRMSLLIQGIYATFLYPTVYNMKLEKELYREHYTVERNAYGLEAITEGLNKIKYVLGEVMQETKEGKQIVERALQERETRLSDAEKVKSGKLTKEELQELINSKRKNK